MASSTTKRWSADAVGELLAEQAVAETPSLASQHWLMRIAAAGWIEMEFDAGRQANEVQYLAATPAEQLAMLAIEQAAALERRGVEAARVLGEAMNERIKQMVNIRDV